MYLTESWLASNDKADTEIGNEWRTTSFRVGETLMAIKALQNLKPAQPRRFVPARADLGEWAQVEPLFKKLEAAAKSRWIRLGNMLGLGPKLVP